MSFGEIINNSINETFARSVFTSMTVVFTLLALLILGGEVIRPLNAALLVGILSGTYSSIFNAAPLVLDFSRWFGTGANAATAGAGVVAPRPAMNPAPSSPSPTIPRAATPTMPTAPSSPGAAATNGAAASYDSPDRTGATPARPRRRRM